MASPAPATALATEVREIARSIAAASDLAAPVASLAAVLAKTKRGSFAEKALAAAGALLQGLADHPPAQRFERLDLALDALDAVAVGDERGPLLDAIARCLSGSDSSEAAGPDGTGGPRGAEPAENGEGGTGGARPPGNGEGDDPADAIENLSGEIVQLAGPTDAAGFQSVEHAARDAQARVMKLGGGSHAVLDVLETMADLAAKASRGAVAASVDVRAVLSAAASELPDALRGDVARATKALGELRRALEERSPGPTTILKPPEVPVSRVLARPEPSPESGARARAAGEAVLALGGERGILDGFVVEAREHLATAEGRLLDLEQAPHDAAVVNDLFRAFHSIKGVGGLLALAPVVRLTHALESLLDAARKGTRPIDRAAIDALLAARDTLHAAVEAVARALEAGQPEARMADPEPLIGTLEALLAGDTATGRAAPAATPAAPAAPSHPSPAAPPVAAPTLVMPREGLNPGAPAHSGAPSGVRVPMERLDQLVALVGEMVISQAQVGHDLSATTGDPDAPLVKETNRLGKITREVQDLSMTLRMLPVQPLFQKLQRLVRDLVRSTGKQVRLETEGEETRLDKSVIDELEDPLVHMVRNAIDHGIESPDERRSAGKAEQGVVRVAAYHAGGEVVIEIQDDGKGLDQERILAKARERGLAPLDATPSEAVIFGYIFEPGLSTAQKVTELSGRGVGMDVVKKNITRLRGKIDIESRRGQGSRFSLKLPLTLAIIDGMIVRVSDERFTLPNFAIEEAIQLRPGELVTAYGRGEMIKVRGALVPFVRLRDVFRLPRASSPEAICVIVETAGERVALGVDEILGQQQIVIKSLDAPFNAVPAIGGATVLGDGRVGLILDVTKLVALAMRPESVEHEHDHDHEHGGEPERARGTTPLEGKYLIAALGDEEYGLPVLAVQEIVTMLPVTAIPLVPPFVKGAVNLRGHVIPVIDLRARLGMEPRPPSGETCIIFVKLPRRTLGVIVDSVREVLNLKREATAAPPRLGPGVRTDFIAGVGTHGDRIAFLLDLERVLATHELLEKKRGPK